jgi:lipoyl(octanoyl) transferase
MPDINCSVQDWGRISYKTAWEQQTAIANELIQAKKNTDPFNEPIPHSLIFCEHNPVYTLGKSGSIDNVLLNEKELELKGIEFFKINRGGDITYHGPGQIVCYPIFDLDRIFTDVHKYVRGLEEVVIRTLAEYGLDAMRINEYTGVWLEGNDVLPKRKICAIGVHLSRWVSMHGFAFNINTDLAYFNHIIPCGIADNDKAVTSLALELGRSIDPEEVKLKILFHFSEIFGLKYA